MESGNQDLIPPVQRLKIHDVKSVLRLGTGYYNASVDHQRIHATLLQVMSVSSRLEQKMERCLWTQKVFIVLVLVLAALLGFTLYIHYSSGYSYLTTAQR